MRQIVSGWRVSTPTHSPSIRQPGQVASHTAPASGLHREVGGQEPASPPGNGFLSAWRRGIVDGDRRHLTFRRVSGRDSGPVTGSGLFWARVTCRLLIVHACVARQQPKRVLRCFPSQPQTANQCHRQSRAMSGEATLPPQIHRKSSPLPGTSAPYQGRVGQWMLKLPPLATYIGFSKLASQSKGRFSGSLWQKQR
jgi:hypothetical protein